MWADSHQSILRPADWQSGQGPDGKSKPDVTIRIVEIISPFGGKDEMITEFAGVVR
jgi:hypothetical protein